MNRVLIMQIILMVTIFAGGTHFGLTLSQVLNATKAWPWLLAPAFGAGAMCALLLLSIVKPERFAG